MDPAHKGAACKGPGAHKDMLKINDPSKTLTNKFAYMCEFAISALANLVSASLASADLASAIVASAKLALVNLTLAPLALTHVALTH